MHRRPVYIYLLKVPSFSSRYFNKIKRTSRLGRLLVLSLEILYHYDRDLHYRFKVWEPIIRLCNLKVINCYFVLYRYIYVTLMSINISLRCLQLMFMSMSKFKAQISSLILFINILLGK